MSLIANALSKLSNTMTMLKMNSTNTRRLKTGYAEKEILLASNSPVNIIIVLKSERLGL